MEKRFRDQGTDTVHKVNLRSERWLRGTIDPSELYQGIRGRSAHDAAFADVFTSWLSFSLHLLSEVRSNPQKKEQLEGLGQVDDTVAAILSHSKEPVLDSARKLVEDRISAMERNTDKVDARLIADLVLEKYAKTNFRLARVK